MIKLTTEQFIEKAIKKHENHYSYENTIYNGYHKKVIIKCLKHQMEFEQVPGNHLTGKGGCKKCMSETMRKTQEEFLTQVKGIHDNFYNYSKVNYTHAHNKITVICPIHAEFQVFANDHIKGDGCYHCGIIKRANKNRYSNEQFIEKAKIIHDDLYDYSLCDYYDHDSIITLLCQTHGQFNIRASQHLAKYGCQKCGKEKRLESSRNNPIGWGWKQWEMNSKTTKYFDSFKVYVIRCWNEEEEFYKIGRTFKTVADRFRSTQLPYNYEIVLEIISTSMIIFNLENELKRKYKKLKRIPNILFPGRYECFNTSLPIDEIINNLKKL